MYYQHGDVLLTKVESLPKNFKETRVKKAILAEGEISGHQHILIAQQAPFTIFEKEGETFIKTDEKTELIHQEHKTLWVDPGIYKIDKVREYDHFQEEARRVAD